nr:MAG TPA: hypothetical protein [Caudoviricetes sp.]
MIPNSYSADFIAILSLSTSFFAILFDNCYCFICSRINHSNMAIGIILCCIPEDNRSLWRNIIPRKSNLSEYIIWEN